MAKRKTAERIRAPALPAHRPAVLLADVREMILQARAGVARAVDTGLTMLYWHVGRRVRQDIPVTEEGLDLLRAYHDRGILEPRFRNDMLHIALATVAQVDVLVSWNFRHIVRLDKIEQFNGVNIELGYKALAIYSPREVTTYGRQTGDQGG